MAERIWVKAGPKLRDGQIAIAETDAAHPLDKATGTHLAYVVKGNAKTEPGQIGLTPVVAEKIRRRELVQVAALAKGKGRRGATATDTDGDDQGNDDDGDDQTNTDGVDEKDQGA